MENGYPLVLVFYLDREMMMEKGVISTFANSVNDTISQRDANCMAFFMPTDGEERIECINPIQVKEEDMVRVNKMIEDLKLNFDIGQGADDYNNDSVNE